MRFCSFAIKRIEDKCTTLTTLKKTTPKYQYMLDVIVHRFPENSINQTKHQNTDTCISQHIMIIPHDSYIPELLNYRITNIYRKESGILYVSRTADELFPKKNNGTGHAPETTVLSPAPNCGL